jgi:hypothetical protein
MSENFVIVHRTHDPFQADLLGQLLRENGIAARVLGTRHGAAIGVGQSILQQHIEVPRSQAGEATDFLESFFEGKGVELLREEAGLDVDPDEADEEDAGQGMDARALDQAGGDRGTRLRALFAGGATLLMFGGSHLYARRFWTMAILAAGQVLALWHIRSLEWHSVATGLVMFAMILVLDAGGGQLAVRAHNRGVRVSPLRQMAIGAVLVTLAGAVGAFMGPRTPAPKRQPDRMLQIQQVEMPQQPSW